MSDNTEINESRPRRYNIRKQCVELRRPNPGKEITDNLPTVQIDPEALDMYSETHPLEELIEVMRNKWMLVTKMEIPKWSKRGKTREYGGGLVRGILKMNLRQSAHNKKYVSKVREEDLSQLKKDIIAYAADVGYICGFTKIDRRFIAKGDDRRFPYDTAVVLGMEMDKELLDEVPAPGDKLFDFEIYMESGKRVFDVANFIRSKGYRCYARVPFDGCVKYPPHAINAGLGELGAMGVVITKEYGPRVRWTMISLKADIEIDKPVDLNMAAYCDDCLLCVKACPGKAISENRIWWRGVLKRKNQDTKCWPYFVEYDGCGICLKVCPIHRYGYDECMEAYRESGAILGKKSSGAILGKKSSSSS
jgi:Pyruvate/2-oxoacid:ferredoxin oxidoreductase delta subunit